jgi:hypothetical protein
MRVAELLESGGIDDLSQVLLLMKHGRLSKEQARELAAKLGAVSFVVGNQLVPTNLRWAEDRYTNALKMNNDGMPGSWRSGTAAMGRARVAQALESAGFSTARDQKQAFERKARRYNGPHIYFWGPGTPAPDEKYRDKVMHGKKLTQTSR